MAKYSDIKGFTVQTVSSDPAASVAATGSWASAGTLNTGRLECFGTGPGTAGMIVNGTTDGSDGAQVYDTEIYNGTSWTEVNNTDQRRQDGASAGVTTSALVTAGYTTSPGGNSSFTESFDGTTWSEETNINNGIQGRRGLGATETAALITSATPSNNCELWNGSSWTEKNNQNTARSGQGTFGTSTAGVVAGGASPPIVAIVESFDGTSWTEIGDLNTARSNASGSGTEPAGLIFSGNAPPATGKTEGFDGTSWTEVGDLSTARFYGAGGGTQASAIFAGGSPTPTKSNAEEWTTTPSALFQKLVEGQLYFNSTANAFKETITDVAGGTWAAGGNMVEGRYGNSGFGNHSNAITAGGQPPAFSGTSSKTEQYDGSAWSEVNDLNTDHFFAGALGSSYTAGIVMAGQTPPGTRIAITESWNGTNWTEVNDLNTARSSANLSATGTSTAGIYAGGRTAPGSPGSPQAVNESWDGTSWTEVNDLNTARYGMGAGGIQTSVLQFGGHSGTAVVNNVESWDGTSWTETTEMNTKRTSLGGTGSNANNILAFGGLDPPGRQNETEFWNGTSWTELNNLSTARQDFGSSSALSITNVIASGGETGPAVSAATEEWTVNLGNKTITTS